MSGEEVLSKTEIQTINYLVTPLTLYTPKPSRGKKLCKFLTQTSSGERHYKQHLTWELIFLHMQRTGRSVRKDDPSDRKYAESETIQKAGKSRGGQMARGNTESCLFSLQNIRQERSSPIALGSFKGTDNTRC